jgi:hypothetical protein
VIVAEVEAEVLQRSAAVLHRDDEAVAEADALHLGQAADARAEARVARGRVRRNNG